MRKEGTLLYHTVAFLTVVIWGSTFISTKVLIADGVSPVQIFTIRFAIAYVLMLACSHRRLLAGSWRDELLLMGLGITGGSAYFLTENEALRLSTATNVSLIVCSCPLITLLLFRLLFHEVRLGKWQIMGAVLSFVGMAMVVLNGHFVLHLSPLGDSLAFGACLCWAAYSVLMRFVNGRYPSAFITRKVFFYGLLTILPYYIFVPGLPGMSVLMQPHVLYNLLFLGCVASMLCFLAWTWVMLHIGEVAATNYVYLNPISTIVFAVWILSEQITPFFILGSVLILIGLYWSNKKAAASLSDQTF